jgi:Kazal-type serine protease inhibitor domain
MKRLLFALGIIIVPAAFGCGSSSPTPTSSTANDTESSSSSKSCAHSSECASGDYCAIGSGLSCSAKGTCQPLPFVCPQICEAVCGCDGNTYDNSCEAQQALTNVAFNGFCEENPATGCWGASGGMACTPAAGQSDCNPNDPGKSFKGAIDDSNLYCTSSNTCATIPSGCKASGGKVCGTDGKTYASECAAFWTGRVAVASNGGCGGLVPHTVSPGNDGGASEDAASEDAASEDAASEDAASDGGPEDAGSSPDGGL